MIDQDLCDHLNAEVEMVEYAKPRWDDDIHSYIPDDSEELPTLICPDCGLEEVQEPDYD